MPSENHLSEMPSESRVTIGRKSTIDQKSGITAIRSKLQGSDSVESTPRKFNQVTLDHKSTIDQKSGISAVRSRLLGTDSIESTSRKFNQMALDQKSTTDPKSAISTARSRLQGTDSMESTPRKFNQMPIDQKSALGAIRSRLQDTDSIESISRRFLGAPTRSSTSSLRNMLENKAPPRARRHTFGGTLSPLVARRVHLRDVKSFKVSLETTNFVTAASVPFHGLTISKQQLQAKDFNGLT